MTRLPELAARFQDRLNRASDRAARAVVREYRKIQTTNLDTGWDAVAPIIEQTMIRAQALAADAGAKYTAQTLRAQGVKVESKVVTQAFAGVTREGRAVVPELFTAVTTTKSLIGQGSGVPSAFQAGAGVLSVLAGTIIRDSGRGAASVAGVAAGRRYYVRVVQPGACSRCAILAGVVGYREPFQRHPECRCTSMWITGNEAPEGFFSTPADYFESLTEAEQDRVFTKSGAWAIRNGADPVKVVNARRGALKSTKRADGTYAPARLIPTTIGVRPDGTPLQVYATLEGTTARSSWARSRGMNNTIRGTDRYRRTSTVRLMPEQLQRMSGTPQRARELLQRYGYIY